MKWKGVQPKIAKFSQMDGMCEIWNAKYGIRDIDIGMLWISRRNGSAVIWTNLVS